MKKSDFLNKYINLKLIFKTVVFSTLFCLLIVSTFAITSYKNNREYCNSQKEYIQVYLLASLEGKYDNGYAQKNSKGEYFINLNTAEHAETINYQGKSIKCLVLRDGTERDPFTFGDLRGEYLADENLRDTEFIEFIPENRRFVCPFSNKRNKYYYFITEKGDILCSCPYCD